MRRLKDACETDCLTQLSSLISPVKILSSISSQHLYPICRVTRQANPRGRPRKAKDGDGA